MVCLKPLMLTEGNTSNKWRQMEENKDMNNPGPRTQDRYFFKKPLIHMD